MGDWDGWEGGGGGDWNSGSWDNSNSNSWSGGGGKWDNNNSWNEEGGDNGGWGGGGGGKGDKKREWTGRRGGKNMYSKAMRQDHGEQMELWRAMKSGLEEATEATLPGLLEAAHVAIADHFESTNGRLFNNGEVSRTIEFVLEWSSATHLRGFFFKLRGWMCFLLTQKTASRVMETLFKQCYRRLAATDAISKSADEEDETGLPTLQALLKGAVEEVIDGDAERDLKLLDLLQDASASFALRVLFQVLAGQRPTEKAKNSSLKDAPETAAPIDGGRLIQRIGSAVVRGLTEQEIFFQLVKTPPVVGALEILMQAWTDGSERLHDQIARDVDSLIKGSVSSRVVENSLKSPLGHVRLHDYILENWETVAGTSIHVVGKWIASCPTLEAFMSAIETVLKGAQIIKERRHYAIAVGAAEGAKPYVQGQSKVLSLMTAVFGDLKELPTTLMNMQGSRSGPVVLSNLLSYGPAKVGVLYRGTLDLPQWQLVQMASAPEGSIVLGTLIEKGGQKEAKKLCMSLEGSYLSITLTSPAGAMTIEKLFGVATLAGRRKIADELGAGIKQMQEVWHAKKTIKKLRLDQFTHRLPEWEEQEKKLVKKNKLLASILNSEAALDATGPPPDFDDEAPAKKGKTKKVEDKPAKKRARDTLSDADDDAAPPPVKKSKKDKKSKK